MKHMKHIMICVERLSPQTNAAFIELCAVNFDISTGEIFNTLDIFIPPVFWGKHGRHIDGTYVMRLSLISDSRKKYIELDDTNLDLYYPYLADAKKIDADFRVKMSVEHALYTLSDWIIWHFKKYGKHECPIILNSELVVWTCDTPSDLAVLQSLCEEISTEMPWKETMVRDAHTLIGNVVECGNASPLERCRHVIAKLSDFNNKHKLF